jgi:hypothetical protein
MKRWFLLHQDKTADDEHGDYNDLDSILCEGLQTITFKVDCICHFELLL